MMEIILTSGDQSIVVTLEKVLRGPGVPVGGATGEVLTKVSGADFDTDWAPAQSPLHFADMETPAGAVDGANTTFTLAHTPSPLASCIGYVQQGGAGAFLPAIYLVDFTLAAAVVTMTTAPDAGSLLRFSYRY